MAGSAESSSPLGNYFELLKGLTGLGASPNAASDNVMAALDPVEIDKKIRELETVLGWVRAQQAAIELSIKTLEFQRNMLTEIGAGGVAQRDQSSGAAEAIKRALEQNPAAWAWKNLQTALDAQQPAKSASRPRKTAGAARAAERKKKA